MVQLSEWNKLVLENHKLGLFITVRNNVMVRKLRNSNGNFRKTYASTYDRGKDSIKLKSGLICKFACSILSRQMFAYNYQKYPYFLFQVKIRFVPVAETRFTKSRDCTNFCVTLSSQNMFIVNLR